MLFIEHIVVVDLDHHVLDVDGVCHFDLTQLPRTLSRRGSGQRTATGWGLMPSQRSLYHH